MSNITDLKLVELVNKIKKKELSSIEVTIDFFDLSIKAIVTSVDDNSFFFILSTSSTNFKSVILLIIQLP